VADELERASFTFDELRRIKQALTKDRPYFERISIAFAARLLQVRMELKEDVLVLDEIDFLEGVSQRTQTKNEEQFRHAPLHPFWHKHFSAPRHLVRNLGDRWGLTGKGNRDLTAMIEDVARAHGDEPGKWQNVLLHRLVMDGYQDRFQRGLTGDWIIYAKHEGRNYYLDLATHQEGREPQRLYEKLRNGSAAEFPFLF
jgi:hypothetical protein